MNELRVPMEFIQPQTFKPQRQDEIACFFWYTSLFISMSYVFFKIAASLLCSCIIWPDIMRYACCIGSKMDHTSGKFRNP